MKNEYVHSPVLLNEGLEALQIKLDGCYVDCTFGRGGHSNGILARLGEAGQLIAIDQDPTAVEAAEKLANTDSRFSVERGSFSMLRKMMDEHGVTGHVDGILLDLGVSSPQLDDPERGFSFLRDGPLDMRMDPDAGISAAVWLAKADVAEISRVLKVYGEERYARRIARAIVKARAEQPLESTGQLAEIIAQAHPAWEKSKHPATRSFQAIRIHVNGELEALTQCLEQSLEVLRIGGRLAVISFHSLEDRIVKRFIRDQVRGDDHPPDLPVRHADLRQRLKSIGKAISPTDEEIDRNPRSRSSVLRVAERLS